MILAIDAADSPCYLAIMNKTKPRFHSLWVAMSADEKRRLATAAHTSVPTLSLVANGHRGAGASLIERLMDADNRITFQMMRREDQRAA